MEYSFGKKEKLKSKKCIEKLFLEGKTLTHFPIKLIYLKTEPTEAIPFQVGVSVAKRNFKKAVHRNRIKRLLRESYRLNKPIIFNSTITSYAILFLYLGTDLPDFATINKKMKELLQQFLKHIQDENLS